MRWKPYVPVAKRRAQARKKMDKLRKQGKNIQPVSIDGRTIARSFWGKNWCQHLESFSDYANRLPRGRTYVRNGSVCHLAVHPGRVEAIVSGSELYHIAIQIKKLKPARWKALKKRCAGHIGSMLELLQGTLSDQVMQAVTNPNDGLFPQPGDITFSCDCPDWADMCKHVAAVLYGIGSRLDDDPALLFLLRDVDAEELIAAELALPAAAADRDGPDTLGDDQLGAIFDIDLDLEQSAKPAPPSSRPTSKRKSKPKSSKPKLKRETQAPPAERPLPKIRPTGQSVARLRKRCGLSAAQFAERLNVAPASVYRWEATPGRLKLQQRTLYALAVLHRQVH